MHLRRLSEKQVHQKIESKGNKGDRVIVCLLHVLLWTSLYVVGGTLYVLISTVATIEGVLVPSVLTAATGLTSVTYVILHNAVTVLSRSTQTQRRNIARLRIQWLSAVTLRLIVLLWLISSGLSVTFTLTRHLKCLPSTSSSLPSIDTVDSCTIQRSTIGASFLALIASLALFVMMYRTEEPFRAHLLGTAKEPSLLPLMLPYKASKQHPMFSEMSFKCRSSTSLSSRTLVPSCDSVTTLLPTKPEKVVGLGIYAPKASATFLGPRPSLSSIRTHTTIGTAPPSSALPPLPTYFPDKFRKEGAIHTAVHPPRRPPRPERSKSERTVRIVPPSPALSITNLKMHNSSMESLSSIYSRSISGEKPSPKVQRPAPLTDSSRSYSSGSTATLVKSPLGAMRLVDQPDIVVMNKPSRISSDSYATEIDDVVTLQAMLPSVKAVSEFGDVQHWKCQSNNIDGAHAGGSGPYREEFRQQTWMPPCVRKTRDSQSRLQCSNVQSLV